MAKMGVTTSHFRWIPKCFFRNKMEHKWVKLHARTTAPQVPQPAAAASLPGLPNLTCTRTNKPGRRSEKWGCESRKFPGMACLGLVNLEGSTKNPKGQSIWEGMEKLSIWNIHAVMFEINPSIVRQKSFSRSLKCVCEFAAMRFHGRGCQQGSGRVYRKKM